MTPPSGAGHDVTGEGETSGESSDVTGAEEQSASPSVPDVNSTIESVVEEGEDTTSAKPLGAARDEPVAESAYGLIDKLASGRLQIQISYSHVWFLGLIGWIVVSLWMWIQDNGAGKLDSLQGWEQLGLKMLGLFGFMAIVGGLGSLIVYLQDRWSG